MGFLRNLFGYQKCTICKGKLDKPKSYYNSNGEKIKVCYKCVPYAERRAFRKV